MQNIHPTNIYLNRDDKEQYLKQKAKVIWITGLSGSGKSTLAHGLERRLAERGYLTQVLDGDNIRTGINNNLGFTEEDRTENIRRIAEINKLFLNCGIISINAFISPTNDIRQMAREIIGDVDFIEIFVDASFDTCAKRDPKGLYKKALAGQIKNFTGLDAPFDRPDNAEVTINTDELSIEEGIEKAYQFVKSEVRW
ncbi:adenylyl-sulfate kinase [Carboxylicivirga sediminis]|uniref:Adenylyl-sulfate kinase n=1 Tax=Carboxylicivirga sediminis TaxID=2006564 RepID=A0A941IXP0_9BACT|nr:adenylyl-sulfate kinase [Carboxylicivirga sediminis]MBR8535753.1 adenylyl-sulfate kinase [Carboxylicivirga sediminis]